MSGLNEIWGIFTFGCGLYCLYGYYMLKFKGEVVSSLLLPKDVDVKKCKDFQGYCKEVQLPLLVLTISVLLCGVVDVYCVFVGKADIALLIMIVVVLVAITFYSVFIKKINKKYFDL